MVSSPSILKGRFEYREKKMTEEILNEENEELETNYVEEEIKESEERIFTDEEIDQEKRFQLTS